MANRPERLIFKTRQKRRVADTDLPQDSQTEIIPSPDPVTIVQICGRRPAVMDIPLVKTPARAYRARPTGVAIVFCSDIAPLKKIALLFAVNSAGYMTNSVAIGIHKTVTRRDVPGRAYAHQTKTRATWMRLAYALVKLSQSIAHIGESVHFTAQSEFQIFVREDFKLSQNVIHAAIIDCIEPVW